jgi:hypothetical protein
MGDYIFGMIELVRLLHPFLSFVAFFIILIDEVIKFRNYDYKIATPFLRVVKHFFIKPLLYYTQISLQHFFYRFQF